MTTKITTANISDDAVTSAKIADDAIVTAAIADDAVTAANIADAVSFGKVLQVKQSIRTSVGNFDTDGTFSDIGLSVDITPSSTSSDILILCQINAIYYAVGNSAGYHNLRIARVINSTTSNLTGANTHMTAEVGRNQSQGEHDAISFSFVDVPNTTSTITYKAQAYQGQGSNNFYYNDTSSTSSIIAIEIEGGLS